MTLEPPAWVADAVFYQVFPDRFARSGRIRAPGPLEPWDAPPTVHGFKGGDLYGVVDRLDHLADLGVTALYLNPIFASASNHRYHTYDYHTVDPLLGGNEAFRALLDAAHGRGMRVVLDGVFNHSSRGFWPFNHVAECGLGSPYVGWFHVDLERLAAGRGLDPYPQGELPRLDHADSPWLTRDGSWSLRELGYRAWWDLPALPKHDVSNPEMREYLMAVGEHWIREGIDGWRLDVAEELPADFWREFRTRIKALNPDAYIVAEVWDTRPDLLQGDRYDALMNYPLGMAAVAFAGGRHLDPSAAAAHATIAALARPLDGPAFAARVTELVSAYPPAVTAAQLVHVGSHDTPRVHALVGGDHRSLALTMLLQLTFPGAPCIYYGDEVGLPGGFDPDCRRSFPWDRPADIDEALLAYVTAVIRLRHERPALRRGSFAVLAAVGGAVAFLRATDGDALVVAVNAGEAPATLELDLDPGATGLAPGAGATLRTLPLPGDAPVPDTGVVAGRATVTLPARSGRVLAIRG